MIIYYYYCNINSGGGVKPGQAGWPAEFPKFQTLNSMFGAVAVIVVAVADDMYTIISRSKKDINKTWRGNLGGR